MDRNEDDYYALLGVEVTADSTQLRRAWRRLALQWHPDHAGPEASAKFQQLLSAYTVLSNPVTRAAYDRKRRLGAPAPAPAPAAPSSERRRAPGVMLRRLSGPLNALIACGVARHAEDGIIELIVDSEAAAQGGIATIAMRVPVTCPACVDNMTVPCAECGSSRTKDELFSAWLTVPPDVADGAILLPSVQLRGAVAPTRFRVRLRGS